MEFTDENKFSQSKIRKDGSEMRHHRRSHRRSSSILKVPQSKLPLTDLDVNQQDDCRVPPFKKARKSENRRVSFADTCQIKEFPKDSPGAWHQENSSVGLDKLLTGNIQHSGFSSAEEDVQEVPLVEDNQVLGVQVDPVNHTIIVDDEMELTALVDAPADDFEELKNQNNKVDYDFLRSLVSADKNTISSNLQIEKPEKLFHVKTKENAETFVYTTMNRYSCLYEDNIQSSLSVLTTGTTTLSSQTSISRRAPLMAVSSSQKPGLDNSICVENIPVEFSSDHDAPTEKPKSTGFLQSLLKNQRKNEKEVVLFLQSSSCSSSHHERTQIFGSGDGMDETTVLDNTIWTMQERDSSRTNRIKQNHVTMEKIHVENTCVFHNGDAMEETKVISGEIWTKEDVCVEGRERTQIFNGDGELEEMDETNVLLGGILTESNQNVAKSDRVNDLPREEEEKTKIFGMEDHMEETRVLTGGIWTGEKGIADKTKTQGFMEQSKPLTGTFMLGQPKGMDKNEDKILETVEKTKIFVQDDMEETEVVSASLLETQNRNEIEGMIEIGNNKKSNATILEGKLEVTAYELKEDDSDEEITFNIKKTMKENEPMSQNEEFIIDKEHVPTTEPTEDKVKFSENAVPDKENGNTHSLADLKARLKEHTTKFDDVLLRPDERLAKAQDGNVSTSQVDKIGQNGTVMFSNKSALLEETKMVTTSIETGSKLVEDERRLEDVNKPVENKTVLFNDKSDLLEETKMMTTTIETASKLPVMEATDQMNDLQKPLENKTVLFSDRSEMLEETKMVTTSIETGSKLVNLMNLKEKVYDAHKSSENKTVLFEDKSAMMEETKAVTANLIEAELPTLATGSGNQMKGMSETVNSLPTMAGSSNVTVFFGNDTGAMEETKIAKSALSSGKESCEGGNNMVPLTDTPMFLKSAVTTAGEMRTSTANDQLSGLMDNGTQGLLEQAPPENLLTDLTLNSTALSFLPPNTSSLGAASSPMESTQALLDKDWDNITIPADSMVINGEEEKSLISQLSINKTVDCDTTQEILEGPLTALSLCNYLSVIKPSCLKVSKVTELRKTRCSFVQEEEIVCEDLKSKLSALLTIQPHIEAQMAVNAQLSEEVERKKIEHERLEDNWQTNPPEIFHYAQTCSQSQKEELREKMMVMSNVCTRQGKIEWKRAGLQAASFELEKIQEGNRKLNVEVEQTLQLATEAVQHIEQVNQDMQDIEREIQELQQMPDQSEEEVQQFHSERISLERKQADLLNLKNEEQSINESNQRLAEEHAALAQRLSESVRLDTEKDNAHTLEVQGQNIHQEIQLLSEMSGWQLKEGSFRSNHKVFTFGRKKFQMEVIHNEEEILSIIFKVHDEDVPSRIDQFCYSLVEEAVNGQYLKHKYSKLSDLPQILHEVGSLVSHVNGLQLDLMLLQLNHCISYRYPSLNLEFWSPKKRYAEVSFLFKPCAGSLLWNIEPSVGDLDGNLREDALLTQINQNFIGNSYLNKVCAGIDLDSIPEEIRPKCPVCRGTI